MLKRTSFALALLALALTTTHTLADEHDDDTLVTVQPVPTPQT